MTPRPPTSTLFPYTTLFRSRPVDPDVVARRELRIEADSQLDERRQQAVHVHGAAVLAIDARDDLQQRALARSEEHTSELQSLTNLVCRLLLEKKNKQNNNNQ